MSRLVLDPKLIAKLGGLKKKLELCDRQGSVLAIVNPVRVQKRRLANEPAINRKEVRRRLAKRPRYSTTEVLGRLKEE